MGICNDDCNCEVEGDRGLEANGIGTPGDPFTVSPETARTIPRTVATFADLPVLADEEAGQLAWVQDTNLLYAWSIVGASSLFTGWQVVAPPWIEAADPSMSIPVVGVPVTSTATMDLPQGRWDITAKGYIDAVVPAGAYLALEIDLVDTVSGLIYDQQIASVWNDGVGDAYRATCWSLQRIKSSGVGSTSPADTLKTISVRAGRLTGDASTGDIVDIKMKAVKVASPLTF